MNFELSLTDGIFWQKSDCLGKHKKFYEGIIHFFFFKIPTQFIFRRSGKITCMIQRYSSTDYTVLIFFFGRTMNPGLLAHGPSHKFCWLEPRPGTRKIYYGLENSVLHEGQLVNERIKVTAEGSLAYLYTSWWWLQVRLAMLKPLHLTWTCHAIIVRMR